MVEGTQFPGAYYTRNYIKNPGAETNIRFVTASGGSLTRTTSTPLEGKASFAVDASASGQTYTWDAYAIDEALKGQNCEARLTISGDGTLYKIYAKEGSNKVSQEVTLDNITSGGRPYSVNFPCGSGGALTFVIESTSASAAAIKVDSVYLGLVTNIGPIQAQPELVASYQFASTCNWANTATSATNLTADTDCTTTTLGGTSLSSISSFNANALTWTLNAKPGTYLVRFNPRVSDTSGNAQANVTVFDGTTRSGLVAGGVNVSGTSFGAGATEAVFNYTASGSKSFSIQAWSDVATGIVLDSVGGFATLAIYYYPPSAGQNAVRADQTNYDWTAYTPTFTGFGTPTGVACWHKREGPDLMLRCNFTTGTTTATEARLSLPNSLVSADSSKLTTLNKCGDMTFGATGAAVGQILCEQSVGYVTFGEQTNALFGLSKLQGTTFANAMPVAFTARIPIAGWTENMKAPPLIGSVTSGAASAERIERAYINNNGTTCSINSQSGSWISSVARPGASQCDITMAAGMFSSAPTCVCSAVNGAGYTSCAISSITSTALTTRTGYSTNGVDVNYWLMCMGPR